MEDIFGRRAFSLFLSSMPECQGCVAKDLLLERCLVKVTSRNLQEKIRFCAGGRLRPEGLLIVSILYVGVSLEVCERKIQVLRWGTSSAGGPSHCFYSLCRCVSRSLREKNSGFALGDVFGRRAMPECQGCMAKDLLKGAL